MTALRVTIPGEPVGKGRPRFAKSGRVWTPEATVAWEGLAEARILGEWAKTSLLTFQSSRALFAGPFRCEINAVKSRPVALRAKKWPAGRIVRGSKPDIDNIAKIVLDAAQSCGLLAGDHLCAELIARGWYAARDEAACVEVTFSDIIQENNDA